MHLGTKWLSCSSAEKGVGGGGGGLQDGCQVEYE